jgi:hypothetical protein
MPTTKRAKRPGSKKKGVKRRNRGLMLPNDPPILVGGGGSTFVYIRKDLMPQLIDPDDVPGGAPGPKHLARYHIFICNTLDVANINVDGGTGMGAQPPKGANKQDHLTHFD